MIIPTMGRFILQKIKEEETVSKTGLILPSSQPKQDRYNIVKKCEYFTPVDSQPREGDVVYIDKYKGLEITCEGQKYLVVNEEDIVAYERQ
jgi:chaperonin GroES